MKSNFARISGMLATGICVIAYFIFSTIDPDYNHYTKAFSELGSLGQPNNLWFSLWGFLIPGLLITFFSLKLANIINNGDVKRYPFILIATSGFLIALGASPMNYRDFSSISSLLHIIGAMGSGLFFIVGAFTVSRQLKKDEQWRPLIKPLLFLAWVLIATSLFRESNFPGLAQKLGILAYYLYISVLSWNAYNLARLKITPAGG